MHANTTRSAIDKKRGRQQVFVCLLVLPFVLFTLSGFTFIPNVSQTANQATRTPLLLTFQMSVLHTANAADDGCSDVVYIDQVSWQKIRIYFNLCALEHLSALTADGAAAAALIDFVSLWCPDCVPVAAVTTAVVAVVGANVANLQYAAQQCGGAYLDINFDGGWQFEPACGTQDEGS